MGFQQASGGCEEAVAGAVRSGRPRLQDALQG